MVFRVAVIFSMHGEQHLTATRGLEYSLKVQRQKHLVIDPILRKHRGFIAEPTLTFFDNAKDAFLAAIEMRHVLRLYNAAHDEHLPIDCIGCHCGQVLLVPNSDIHWGVRQHRR